MEYANIGLWAVGSTLACVLAVLSFTRTDKPAPRVMAGATLLASFANLVAASFWLLPFFHAASATAAQNAGLKAQIEDLRARPTKPTVEQAQPAPPATNPDDTSAKRRLLAASNTAREFLAGRPQDWVFATLPGADAEQSPNAAIDHAVRTLEGIASLRVTDTHLDEFTVALHRLRFLSGEPRPNEARAQKIAVINEHLHQLTLEKQQAAAKIAAAQKSARNSFPDYRIADTYSMLKIPQPEYRRGQKGSYYLVNFNQGVFERSRYVLDSAAGELVKSAARQFETDLLRLIPPTQRVSMFVRGTADDTTWTGTFTPGHEYRSLSVVSGDPIRGYTGDADPVQLSPPLTNKTLPDLRAAHLQQLLSGILSFESAQILKGHYCQRQAELIVYVDW